MEKLVRIFKSFAEAEAADKEYYRTLTPAQRIEILLLFRKHYQPEEDESRGRIKRVCRIINLNTETSGRSQDLADLEHL